MSLTDLFVKNLKAPEKACKFTDSDGLYLYASPKGLKSWRFDYRFQGKRLTLTFGTYPLISLKEARNLLIDARRSLKAGIDPSAQKQILKKATSHLALNSFETVAREWFERKKEGKKESYSSRIWGRVEQELLPFLSSKPIDEISAQELLGVLRKVEDRGAVVTAHRCLQYCGQIFRYSIATGRANHDISADLRGALRPAIHNHMASLTDPNEVGGLMRAIDAYSSGNLIVRAALKLAPFVFVRPGELRHAEWREINLEQAEWRIPADKMKMKQVHIVPLATQVVDIITELKPYTGNDRYLFSSLRTNNRPISDMTLLAGLRRLGYSKEEMTVHGFRSIASTLLNELGYN
jgi:integrase